MPDLDRIDVEAMIRDAGHRYASSSEVDSLRVELRGELADLRAAVMELRAEPHSLDRTLNDRTAHLV